MKHKNRDEYFDDDNRRVYYDNEPNTPTKRLNYFFLGMFFAIIGYIFGLLGLLSCDKTEDKNKFISGFLIGLFVPVLVILLVLLIPRSSGCRIF